MEQIFSGSNIVGKTIKKVFGYEKLFLVFTDDTFCAMHSYGDEDVYVDTSTIDLNPALYNVPILFELGLITDKQRSDIIKEANSRQEKHQEKLERQEFERLKKKYAK